MAESKHRIALGITGASGSIYAKVLIDKLQSIGDQIENVGDVLSNNAKTVWEHELGNNEYKEVPFPIYEKKDFNATFASGSARNCGTRRSPRRLGPTLARARSTNRC